MSASPTSTVPSIGAIAAGLVTAAVSTSAPAEKAIAAVEHGEETFVAHNPELVPLLDGAKQTVAATAEKHGLEAAWDFFKGLFKFLTPAPKAEVTLPTTGTAG